MVRIRPRVRVRHLALLGVLVQCARGEPPRGNDTATVTGSPPVVPPDGPRRPPTWDAAAGRFFATPGRDSSEAWLVNGAWTESDHLDTLHLGQDDTVRDVRLRLLAGAESPGVARIAEVLPDTTPGACAAWPRVRLVTEGAAPWRVAIVVDARVTSVAFDSLPLLAPRDSLRRVVSIARAASRVPGDTAVVFRGRPWVVRQANQVRFADAELLLAEVTRTVQQEANPLQEHLMLLLEPDSAREEWKELLAERIIGLEETVPTFELLAGLMIGTAQAPALLLRQESDAGVWFLLLQRSGSGRWAVQWRSALATC
jgi:hypothetical protein